MTTLRALLVFSIAAAPLLFAQLNMGEEVARRRVRAESEKRRRDEFYRTRAYPLGVIPAGARAAAVAEMERMMARERSAGETSGTWTLIGPRPTNTLTEFTNGGSPYSSGRVSALAVDPRDADVAYLGAAAGGVWKTLNGGQTWTPLTDTQPSMATGAIAIAPSNPDIVYVGTGEQNNSGDSYYGAGILKSTDGGTTWTQQEGPFVGPFGVSRTSGGGARIGGLAVHPTNPNIVLAGVDRVQLSASGVYRTIDGGTDWTLVLPGSVGTEVLFHPTDPTIAYAALGITSGSTLNGVYRSSDGGATWTRSNGSGATALPAAGIGRVALAIAPSSPNVLYAGIENAATSALLGMYRSADGGQAWTRLNAAPDYCAPQCYYNNVIRVSPVNSNVVVAGGVPPFRSLDGGLSWFNIATGANGLVTHVDHHALAFSRDGSRLYDGNDGGVYSTTNLTAATPSWANLNATLAITEFSSNVSIHPSDPRIAYAGTQDNGTQAYYGSMIWDMMVNGDGGFTAIDPAVPGIWYGSFQNIAPYKLSNLTSLFNFTNPFTSIGVLRNGIDLTDRSLFYPPMAMDPSNPLRLYFGTRRLYGTYDGAGAWNLLSPDLTSDIGSISAISASPSAYGTVAVGNNVGRVYISKEAGPGGFSSWTDRSTGLPGRSVSAITFDPTAPDTLYATISGFAPGFSTGPETAGHVFKSTDLGRTWTNISSELPNIPVTDIVADPDVPGTLYVATDVGVFRSTDSGQSWITLANGLPRVIVQGLNLHRASRTLRAVTRGRSMWDLSVPLAGLSRGPRIESVSGVSTGTLTVTGANFAASSIARWNGVDRVTTFVDAGTIRVAIPAGDLAKAGRATLVIFNPAAGGGLSNSFHVSVGGAPAFTVSGITSAAFPSATPLVPGSMASIFGSNLAAERATAGAPPLPYTLGGVTLEVNGWPAALYFVGPGQINFQVPWELEGHSYAVVTITNGTWISSVQAPVAFSAPTLFSTSGNGAGQGAATIAGPEVLAAAANAFPGSRPVRRGEFLQIFGTGLGPVRLLQGDGLPKPTTSSPSVSRTPEVTIGGVPATVVFAGLTPGLVGVYQINIEVPDNAPSGNAVPIVARLSGATSNTVTVAVQ